MSKKNVKWHYLDMLMKFSSLTAPRIVKMKTLSAARNKNFTIMKSFLLQWMSGLILGLRPANERRCYKVTPSLIGWAQTQNQPWLLCQGAMCQAITKRKMFLFIIQSQHVNIMLVIARFWCQVMPHRYWITSGNFETCRCLTSKAQHDLTWFHDWVICFEK